MNTLSGQIKFLGKFLTRPGIWVLCQGKIIARNFFFERQSFFYEINWVLNAELCEVGLYIAHSDFLAAYKQYHVE